MRKNGTLMIIAYFLLCLTFNYTFPLRRERSKWNIFVNRNDSLQCDKANKHDNIFDRAAHIENALEIMKESSDNEDRENMKTHRKCFESHANANDDLSHFEQLVIKKKNPYVDLKELELKYYNPKNTRQSVESGSNGDPSLCEPLEEGPSVEITNRGLSGFAIPTILLKGVNTAKTKIKLDNQTMDNATIKTIAKVSVRNSEKHAGDIQLLAALESDVMEFENEKLDKIIQPH